MGSSGGKGISDMIGATFDPIGSIFGDSLGFDADPIGNMIGQSVANVSGLITGERSTGDVQDNFFGSNWIGDMANPMVGGKSRQMTHQEETNRMWDQYYAGAPVDPEHTDLTKPFMLQSEAPKNEDEKRERARHDVKGGPASLLTEDEEE